MLSYPVILAAVLPVGLLLVLGVLLRWRGVFTPQSERDLARLVINVLIPALLLSFTLGNEALGEWRTLVSAPVAGYLTVACGFAVAGLAAGLLRGSRSAERRAFTFTTGLQNFGYFPIPLIAALFPGEAQRETLGVLFVYNTGVEMAIWTVGIVTLTGSWDRRALKRLLNPPLIALLTALALNGAGVSPHLPGWVMTTIDFLGRCAIPLGILVIGSTLYEMLNREAFRAGWGAIAAGCLEHFQFK